VTVADDEDEDVVADDEAADGVEAVGADGWSICSSEVYTSLPS